MNIIEEYGFTHVHSSARKLLAIDPPSRPPRPMSIAELPVPYTMIAVRIDSYVKQRLSEPTYNHSLRVYHFGLAIKKYRFPKWKFSDETYYLACLLHDIGTTDRNLGLTRLSFEFYGALIAYRVLQDTKSTGIAPADQSESVVEAIIRHQDLREKGKITALGQLLQLATIFDNAGLYENLVHETTINEVTKSFPRMKWSNCFVDTIRKEIEIKPWSHTTTLGKQDFPDMVLSNRLMARYESFQGRFATTR